MRFLIYGAGAIGLWLAIRLHKAGHQVTCIARQPIVDAMRRGDTAITPLHGSPETAATVQGYAQLQEVRAGFLQNIDYVLLCVKAYGVSSAIGDLIQRNVVRQSAGNQSPVIVCFQNGVGSEELVAAKVGESHVIAATTTMPVTMPTPGLVCEERDGGAICLAPLQGSLDQQLLDAFRGSRIRVKAYGDYRALKWSKLFLNIMGNASSAILDIPAADVYKDTRLFHLEARMLGEVMQVAEASGVRLINLPSYPAATLSIGLRRVPLSLLRLLLLQRVSKGRGAKRPSLYYELMKQTGRSEIAWLNGAVVTRGQELRVPTPVNAYLTAVYERLMSGKENWDEWRGRADRLLSGIR